MGKNYPKCKEYPEGVKKWKMLILFPKNLNRYKLSERKYGDIEQQLYKCVNTCFTILPLEIYPKGMM